MRIDFHIHSVVTPSDAKGFDFDIDVLRHYVEESKLDAIAITNHNGFYVDNYKEISEALSIPVFPGIEINVAKQSGFGHVLIIGDPNSLDEFIAGSNTISQLCPDNTSFANWDDVLKAYPSLEKWLVIPHFKKDKHLDSVTLEKIRESVGIDALEVSNEQRWLQENDSTEEPLVVFSDSRPGFKMPESDRESKDIRYRYGWTYLEVEQLSIPSIKRAFASKRNVTLFDGEGTFRILPGGLPASRRLNVIIGRRSSGKSVTLKRIADSFDEGEAFWIHQFDIASKASEKEFDKTVKEDDQRFFRDYFKPLQEMINDYTQQDHVQIEDAAKNYLDELIVYAKSPANDCSKLPVYNCQPYLFDLEDNEIKHDVGLLKAVKLLYTDERRTEVIDQTIGRDNLAELYSEIYALLRESIEAKKQKEIVNGICISIQGALKGKTSRKPLPSQAPVREMFKHAYREHLLSRAMDSLFEAKGLESEPVAKFLKKRSRRRITGATEGKKGLPANIKQDAGIGALYNNGDDANKLVRSLRILESSTVPYACQLLFCIETEIIDTVSESRLSGGQRAEYILLNELNRAKGKDIVLIDEPESSFDNPFLNTAVSQMINDLADTTPVFLVTHNNTLGVSISPDWVILTTYDKNTKKYAVYSGCFTSDCLRDLESNEVSMSEVLLFTMEAGEPAYLERAKRYGITEN